MVKPESHEILGSASGGGWSVVHEGADHEPGYHLGDAQK